MKAILEENKLHIVDRSYLEKNLASTPHSSSNLILQSSSGYSSGTTLRISRTIEDITDIFHRTMAYFLRIYDRLPKSIVMIGGISHAEAVSKFTVSGIDLQMFSLNDLPKLQVVNPEIIACYPSIVREIIVSKVELSNLKMIKLGGERLLKSDLQKIKKRFSEVPVLEQLGSTEMPALAFRLHKNGVMDTHFHLERERYSFYFPVSNGWTDLIVKDNFNKLVFDWKGAYYNTGDEVLLRNSQVVDVRRKNDPAYHYFPLVEELLEKGCVNVQINANKRSMKYIGRSKLPKNILFNSSKFKLEQVGLISRFKPSNKLQLFIC